MPGAGRLVDVLWAPPIDNPYQGLGAERDIMRPIGETLSSAAPDRNRTLRSFECRADLLSLPPARSLAIRDRSRAAGGAM
jgi:hypothetical protein